LKAIYDELVNKKVNFIDKKFPPKLSTIGDDSRIDTDMRSAVWLRPNQLFNSNYELFDGINPDDIKQGSLGVCYYLSTISALAER
jgi:calpain-15